METRRKFAILLKPVPWAGLTWLTRHGRFFRPFAPLAEPRRPYGPALSEAIKCSLEDLWVPAEPLWVPARNSLLPHSARLVLLTDGVRVGTGTARIGFFGDDGIQTGDFIRSSVLCYMR